MSDKLEICIQPYRLLDIQNKSNLLIYDILKVMQSYNYNKSTNFK